ncbi:MAG: hypothetical protein ACRC33_16285 [Gemmataceae bacterium]
MSALLVAEYGEPGEVFWRRVTVDPDAGTATFERCHIPARSFTLWPEPEFACPAGDIRGTYWTAVRDVGAVLVIVTRRGRAALPQSAVGFEAVRSAVEGWAGSGAGLSWYEYPAGQFALALAAVVVAVVAGLAVAVSGVLPAWAYVALVLGPVGFFVWVLVFSAIRGKPLW